MSKSSSWFAFRTCTGLVVALMLHVMSPAAAGQTPNCTSAVPDDSNADDQALNACLSNGGTVVLEAGVYIIAEGLSLTVDGTVLLGAGGSEEGTVLRAWSGLIGPIIDAEADDFEIAHVYIDGQVGDRTYEYMCDTAFGEYRWWGYNVQITGSGFSVHDSVIAKAMCGSGMEVYGSDYEIYDNTFWANGIPEDWTADGNLPWADGLTLLLCDGGSVHDNFFADNTDLGIGIGGTGGGSGCTVEYNLIGNYVRRAFAGLHIGYFAGGDGDHSGSSYSNNEVVAYYNKAAFGIAVGFHPWDDDVWLSDAGNVTNNTVEGGVVCLAVDGISDGTVSGNTMSDPTGNNGFGSCTISDVYTAACFSGASLQSGWTCVYYHGGQCVECDDR